ncbi:MAG: ubiquitin-like domain-containing protein [Nakamurella sp.]
MNKRARNESDADFDQYLTDLHAPQHAADDADPAAGMHIDTPAAPQSAAGSSKGSRDADEAEAADSAAADSAAADSDDAQDDIAKDDAAKADVAPAARRGLRRKVLLVAAAATIGVLAVGGGTAAAMAKHVTITVDGQQREITTLAGSVSGALSSAGLSAGEHDVLAPAADAQIADGGQIALERARMLSLTINGHERDVWTTADTVDQALVQLGQDPAAFQLSADRSREIPLDGLALTANALRSVSLSVAGAVATPVQTGAGTVGDVLADQGISLSATDTVEPALTTPVTDGLPITVTRVVVSTVTETVPLPITDQQVDDPALDKGTTAVAVAGTAGQQQVLTQVTTTNGVETGRQEISRTTVTESTPNQVHVGSKSTLDVQGSRVFFHDTEFGVNWDGLAYCESTNNPHAVNNPSGYLSTYGLFQFDLPTWASVGGSGNPGDAGPEEQLVRAKLLYQSRGLEPWLCGYAASGPPAG